MKRIRAISTALCLMLTMVLAACSGGRSMTDEQGLHAVTVDGIVADITATDDELKAALGDRYGVLESILGFDVSTPSEMLLSKVMEKVSETQTTKVFFTTGFGEPDSRVVFYGGVRSDSSYQEYLSAYDGCCFIEEMSEQYKKLIVVQFDGEVMTAEKLTAMAQSEIDSGAYENFYPYINAADYTAYRIEQGSTKEAVAIECTFDGEKCVTCELLVLESEKK